MISARLKSFRQKKQKKGRVDGLFIKLGLILFIAIVLFGFLRLNTKYWNGHDKISYVFGLPGGDVGITVLDPKLTELTTLTIPGDTEVDVAENYGTLRIKNVWQLSENEKLAGRLLPETISQNFLFPVYLWSGQNGKNIGEEDLGGIFEFVFANRNTNIPIGDRLYIGLFALKVGSLGKTQINLGASQFLHKETLNDGHPGYRLSGTPPEKLTVYFSDNDLSDSPPRIYIVDATGSPGVSDKIGQILEVLGGKVVSIDKKNTDLSDCVILGSKKAVVQKVARFFSCKPISGQTAFDLEVRIGQAFAQRF